MKKVFAIVVAATLALGVAACATARADSDVRDGSATSSSQAANASYEPIELAKDNPLRDVEIASVSVRLYGVGETELTEIDTQTILGIMQNDARSFDDFYEGASEGITSNGLNFVGPPTFVVRLATGEELVARAFYGNDFTEPAIYFGDYRFDLTADEFESYDALFKDYCAALTESAGEKLAPYAELTADDLESATRLNYTSVSSDEQELNDEQLALLIEALNELEIEPASADFNLPMTVGGSCYYFRLTFKNGQSYDIGASTAYLAYDENGKLIEDAYPVVFIDKTIYRCNKEAASDIYWTFEEMDPIVTESFLYGRELPDYKFENLKVSQIQSIYVYAEYSGRRVELEVPLDIAREATEMLRSLLLCDDNKLENEERLTMIEGENAAEVEINLTTTDRIRLGVDGDKLYFNYWYYTEDTDVIEAVEDFIELAREKANELLGIDGDTQGVKFVSDVVSNTMWEGKPVEQRSFFSLELPGELLAHDDGYYADGYTLDTAPFVVQVAAYDTEMSVDSTGLISFLTPDYSLSSQYNARKEAAGGEGYTSDLTGVAGIAFNVTEYVDDASGDHEWMFVSDTSYYVLEIHVIDRGGSDLTIDNLLALLQASLYKGNE